MSNKILARTSTCTRTSAFTESIVAIRYESKDPWRKQRKLRECKRRAGRFNVVISISCLQIRLVCSQIAYHAAQIQSRLYDHNVFVQLEKLRAHPASNARGPLNESWHEMLATSRGFAHRDHTPIDSRASVAPRRARALHADRPTLPLFSLN
jgi:hypothetical protein